MRFSLKCSITATHVCFQFGILTPSFGALAAIPIMFLNAVCSNAWMGYAGHEHGIREEILNTHLIGCNQPVNSCLTETCIWIWNNRLTLMKMRVEPLLQFLRVLDLLLLSLGVTRKHGYEVTWLHPLLICDLQEIPINEISNTSWSFESVVVLTLCIESKCRRRVVTSFVSTTGFFSFLLHGVNINYIQSA